MTGSPFNTAGTSTRVQGSVVSTTGGDVEYWVQYGLTTAYGSETAHETVNVPANEGRDVSARISGLDRSTTYHYRFCAQDSDGGPGCGSDKSFTTANVDCGDTITADVVLSRSVFCESFAVNGLIVGADGVDIDLAGNALIGPQMIFFDSATPTAIDNSGGYDDMTVRNGSLPRWGLGVDHEGASDALIRNVGIGPGRSGVRIRGGADNAIRSSGLPGGRFGSGLLVDGSDGLVVADSTGNQWSVTGNLARIVRNELASGAQFSTCLTITGSDNLLKDNKVDGCESGSIVVTAGVENVLIDNEAFGSDSFVEGDESDGIRVAAATSGTLLRGNFTHDNADDGIDVQSASTRLKANRADDNGDFGIDAVAGVKDLGGNTASGNGNPLQCRNVFCQ